MSSLHTIIEDGELAIFKTVLQETPKDELKTLLNEVDSKGIFFLFSIDFTTMSFSPPCQFYCQEKLFQRPSIDSLDLPSFFFCKWSNFSTTTKTNFLSFLQFYFPHFFP